MYAVVAEVEIESGRKEEAAQLLKDVTVPMVKGLAGFKRGTWARSLDGTHGRSMLLLDSEADAKAAVEQLRTQGPPPGAPVTIKHVEAYEVVAEA